MKTNRQSSAIALLRITFGIVWAIDAQFKWRLAFASNFTSYIQGAMDGQPAFIQAWLNFWVNLVISNPMLIARLVALGETAIAIGLIFGLFSNLTYAGGALLSFIIWAVPEGLGGPYVAGSTDVGTGIIYVFVFTGLYLLSAGQHYGLDRKLREKLSGWRFLSSAPKD
jgi:thiosulfate dehydrogenase [quinone] large subunit